VDFSDYIVYADESGDHSLTAVNAEYPVFALAFCIFPVKSYVEYVVPAVQRLKFDFFGHDQVILHENEIRRRSEVFHFAGDRDVYERFVERIDSLIRTADMTVIASVINKEMLAEQYFAADDPYDLALLFCMERCQMFFDGLGQTDCRTHIVFEGRGTSEDDGLQATFEHICGGANLVGAMPNLELKFADKRVNSAGLQIADLIVRPIAQRVLRPQQPNRAADTVYRKLRRGPSGELRGWGLKVFPEDERRQ